MQGAWRDAGSGVRWRPVYDRNDRWIAIDWKHLNKRNPSIMCVAGGSTGSFVAFEEYGLEPMWKKTGTEDNLTLAPSLKCNVCGCHGFIEGGKWRPA